MKPKTVSSQTVINEESIIFSLGDEESAFAKLAASLAEIRKLKGVNGFILRNNTSALVDLAQSDMVSEYAILSSQIHESCEEMVKIYDISPIDSIVVEGKNIKILCVFYNSNTIDIFMQKSADHDWITKRILL